MKAWNLGGTACRQSLVALSLLAASASCAGSATDEGSGGDGDGDGDGQGPGDGGDGAGTGGDVASGGSGDSGGSGSGGDVTTGGAFAAGGTSSGGDSSGGETGSGGDAAGGAPACAAASAGPVLGGSARSSGFSGTDAEYGELYSDPCEADGDCDAPCEERGGTAEFCATSVCIESMPNYCLPPTKWRSLEGALTVGESTADAAVTSLSLANGDEHDLLLVDDFGLEVPADATIVGIVASVRKAKGVTDSVTDYRVQLLKGGELVGDDLGSSDQWPTALTSIDYGSDSELWGETWEPDDVNDEGFGVAIGALPGQSSGRAYVDSIEVTIHYVPACP